MATSKFINYFSYTNLYEGGTANCGINPNTGIINFFNRYNNNSPIHFTNDAKIKFVLNFLDKRINHKEIKEDSLGGNTNITKDENNVYTFSAKTFPKEQKHFKLWDFQNFQIIISEGSQMASVVFDNTDDILEKALNVPDDNNIFFRFSYDVTDANCTQFNNCILHIGQDINSNITYMKWISPIACGNDIKPYIKGITSTTLFDGSLNKCIKATSSSKWTSAFKKIYGTTTVFKGNYSGNIKSSPSKDYDYGNLVRFQDIDLTSITDQETNIDINPDTPYN